MTQEDKELLLKDLCARLPYGVKCQIQEGEDIHIGTLCRIEVDNKNGHLLDFVESIKYLDCQFYISEVKPYLFPLSSMTEEQIEELESLMEVTTVPYFGEVLSPTPKYYDWLDKNKFDYRGLISLDLAINVTGLNIY